jgi:LacI family transcriptional regulator
MADLHSVEIGEKLTRELLQLSPRPDGIFAFNDPMGIGAMHAITAAGLRIPEEIAVIGAGNLYYSRELRIPLSTIDQQTEQTGERTARLLLSLLEDKTPQQNKTVLIEPRLVVRASTDKSSVLS